MRTAAVVLNYGDPSDTLGCLASIELGDDLDLHLYVVDNGPDDDAHRALRHAVGRRATVLATGENLGYAGGNNVGIRRALDDGADLVWVLNPDTRAGTDSLSALKAHMADYPDCGIVSTRLLRGGPERLIWFDGGRIDPADGATSHIHSNTPVRAAGKPQVLDVDYVTGAAPLFRADALRQVGLLPEHYFLYFEETDWCVRAQRAGWRTMVDQRTTMVHLKRSSGDLPTPYFLYYMTRNRYAFARDVLGIDPERSLKNLEATFLASWREKVGRFAPAWSENLEELITIAVDDARAGRFGRNDAITTYPAPIPAPVPGGSACPA